LWILTEERPKKEVIANILHKFSEDNKLPYFIDTIRILVLVSRERYILNDEAIYLIEIYG